jgi:2-polyprenyl-6-methoxyphenol hydroxylase-like FAD-dependent oxidoreductase
VAAGSTTPGSGGILRPTLHRILSESVLGSGATVRLGVTVDTITQIGERVEVRFSDGREDVLDLVVGADGLGSKVRRLLFPGAPGPVYTGQVCWRVNAPRAPEIVRRRYFLGGPQKAGLSPVAQDQMYLFLLQTQPIKQRATGDLHGQLRAMLAPFGGALADLRESLSEETVIVPRPLETFVLPAPWFAGSVVLIGDAAHPTTPHLASGAGLAIEDGLVLAEEMGMGGRTPDALARFTERRYARCSLVVQNSAEIGRRELANAPPAEQTELITETLRALGRPY